ncbi:MAG: homoserine kinase [Parvularculaceae bacterium]
MAAAEAFAPATVANLGAGFDFMGMAIEAVGDRVRAEFAPQSGLRMQSVCGLMDSLPGDVSSNTALRAAQAVLDAANSDAGIAISVEKGAPLSAGMGGSASSAVAAALAVNALLGGPLDKHAVLRCALEGERASSDPPPVDNVAASLYGGLILVAPGAPFHIARLNPPAWLRCVVIHPDFRIETRAARQALSSYARMDVAVRHAAHAATLVAGLQSGDEDAIRRGLNDILVEPQRRSLAPFFGEAKSAAIAAGALGASFSGSGPSLFALCERSRERDIAMAMRSAIEKRGYDATPYFTSLNAEGARVECVS